MARDVTHYWVSAGNDLLKPLCGHRKIPAMWDSFLTEPDPNVALCQVCKKKLRTGTQVVEGARL